MDKHPIDYQKEMLVQVFEQAKAYLTVIMVTGYAGLFSLWTLQADKLTPATSLGVGLLLAISVSAFVGWEVYGMLQRYLSLSIMRKSLDSPARTAEELKKVTVRGQRMMRQLERSFAPVIVVAGGTAVLAMAILVNAFGHGLLLRYGPALFSKESTMEFNFLSLVLGGLIAGLVGVACFRLEAWRNSRNAKKALAKALEADMRSTVDLYDELIQFWNDHGVVLYDFLEQIALIRSNFGNDRVHFGLLNDEDMRGRLNQHFRTSFVTLSKLRPKQEDIYGADSDDAKAKLTEQLSNLIEKLSDHRAEANEVADQLALRF